MKTMNTLALVSLLLLGACKKGDDAVEIRHRPWRRRRRRRSIARRSPMPGWTPPA